MRCAGERVSSSLSLDDMVSCCWRAVGGFVCCVAAQAVTLLRGCSYGLRYSAVLLASFAVAFIDRCK